MPRVRAESILHRMVSSMRHESFYIAGTWIDEKLGVYCGWVARDKSFSADMPLQDPKGEATLIFSGEDYSRGRMSAFEQGGDRASYLLERRLEDRAFPASLNGRFQGLLADGAQGSALLFNDRYGMHRLYYHESEEAFYFSAEAKALLAVCPELRALDPQGLGEFLSCGCVMQNRTLFQGIHLLPAGASWSFRDAAVTERTTYFEERLWEQEGSLSPDEYYREIRGAFSKILPRYFQGPERIGMSLTGGLDTRVIMAWRQPNPGTLPCYTFGGPIRDCRDVTVARQVAQACGQSHEVIRTGDEFLAKFASYAERTVFLTDGCVQVARSPVLYASELARAIAPVRMTGNYGDQVLRGLRAFKPGRPLPGLFVPELEREIHRCRETYAETAKAHPLSFVAFRQAPWYYHGLLALEETQVTMRSPFMDNELVRLAFQAPRAIIADNDFRVRLIADGNPGLVWPRTDLGFGGEPGSSLTGRFLQEWHMFTFRAEYAFDHGMPQWLAKVDRLLAPSHWERLFLGRHKYTHFRVWYRDRLASYVREMLLDPQTLSRPYLNRRSVERVVEGHLTGGRNYTSEIHKLLTLEIIQRSLLGERR